MKKEKLIFLSHHFVPGEAGWCPWALCFSCAASRGKGKGDVGPGGDSAAQQQSFGHTFIFKVLLKTVVIPLNRQMYDIGEEKHLILVIS